MFDAQFGQHGRAVNSTNASPRPNAIFVSGLILGEESVENILNLPEDTRARVDLDRSRIKVVTNKMGSAEEGGGRWWLRVVLTCRLQIPCNDQGFLGPLNLEIRVYIQDT
jgi:hypothetical protein